MNWEYCQSGWCMIRGLKSEALWTDLEAHAPTRFSRYHEFAKQDSASTHDPIHAAKLFVMDDDYRWDKAGDARLACLIRKYFPSGPE